MLPAHLLSSLIDAAFPPACAACRRTGSGLCDACAPVRAPVERVLTTLRVRALGEYDGAYQRAVRALKDGRRDAADALGERLAALLAPGALLVPVPTTAARRRIRGFDGVEYLAEVAAARTGASVLCALRCIARQTQRGRSRDERLAARGRVLAVSDALEGASVVLVDDVCTTGATLEDCASILRAAGARVSQAFVVAVANGRA